MVKVVCLECSESYDSLFQHYCWKDLGISGVANRNPIVLELPDSLDQGFTYEPCVQINEIASVGTKSVHINQEYADKNYFSNQLSSENSQPTSSSQDLVTLEASNHLRAMKSEQRNVGEWTMGGLTNQVLLQRNKLYTKECNMAMPSSVPNSKIASNIDRLSGMVREMELNEDNLKMPSLPNSPNNRPEFSKLNGSVNNRTKCDFPTVDTFESIQTWKTIPIPVDAAQAIAGPSVSQFNEGNTSVCLKQIQSSSYIKQQSVQLKSHIKRNMIFREGAKLWKCDVCGKSFGRKWDLQRHSLTHKGNKTFQCKICGKSLTRNDSLKAHALIHMNKKTI